MKVTELLSGGKRVNAKLTIDKTKSRDGFFSPERNKGSQFEKNEYDDKF